MYNQAEDGGNRSGAYRYLRQRPRQGVCLHATGSAWLDPSAVDGSPIGHVTPTR